MNDRPTADWIPSHVEITIHQARELLLKNKNANSELYVSVQVEKEKFTTGLIPRDTAPQWNFVSEIPLMSLDTTIHLTVRQKGRLGDQFIGHIPIPLRNFNISSKLVTHWYKLGSRPGKIKNKLRGDLQVSIRFLSNWSSSNALTNGTTPHRENPTFAPHSPSNNRHPGRMLTRSKSEMRVKTRDVMATGLLDGKSPSTPPLPTVKDRLSSVIRRSFRRKNKAPVFQECEDDFTFSHSPSVTPVLKKRSNTVNSFLYPQSDSDSTSGTSSEVSQSPATVRHPSIQVQAATGTASTTNGGGRESESSGDNQEETSGAVRLRDKKSEWQRGGKRRWTMNTLPLISTTPTSNSTHVPGLSPSPSPSSPFVNSDSGQSPTEDSTNAAANDNEDTVVTYRAKSNTLAISPHLRRSSDRPRSYSITSSQGSVRSALLVEQESVSESCSGVTTPISSSRRNLKDHSSAESGYSTGSSVLLEGGGGTSGVNVGKSSIVSEESGSEAGNGAGGSKMVEQSKASQKNTTTPAGNKRPKQLIRRNTSAVSNPSRSRAGNSQARSRLESADGSANSVSGRGASSRGRSTTDPNSNSQGGTPRRKALSPPMATPNRKLQPATPVRRSEKAHLAATQPKSMIATTPSPTTGGLISLAKSNEGVPKKSTSKQSSSQVTEDNQVNNKSTDSPTSAGEESSSELSSRADRINSGEGSDAVHVAISQGDSPENKMKHTVAYKDTSPLYKDGFQPVPLLPPSVTEYQSQTLPLRGKLARRRSTETALMRNVDTVELHVDDRLLSREHTTYTRPMSTDSAHRINRSPQNTKLIHRSSMNYVIGGNQKKTPSILPPSGGLDETDGAAGDALLIEGVCSKSSITSASSTSTSSRPSTPSTPKYGSKTPGEIVVSALRNKSRPTGYIRKAIGMYQENRRQLRRSLQENKHHSCFLEEELVEDSDKQTLLQPGGMKNERVSASAGNSPQQLRRNRSAAETLTGLLKNPFNSLRRSRSSAASSRSPSSRPVSMLDMGDLGISPDLLERLHSSKASRSNTSLEVTADPALHQKTSAPALLAYRTSASGNSAKPLSAGTFKSAYRSYKSATSEPIIRVRTPSITESSSVKTLTEMDASLRESAASPNPAGASPISIGYSGIGSGHSRHTTCSSVDSEGFVSVTSEELTLEELAHQDWSQWSKEDLYKELILSKQALRRKDQELKDIKGYLDNLLLRIMDSNPTLLSSSN